MPDVVDSCVFGGAWGLLKRHCLNNGVTLQTRACKREENYAKKRLPEGHMAAALAHHVAASLLCGAYLCLSVAGAAILGDSAQDIITRLARSGQRIQRRRTRFLLCRFWRKANM